MIEFGEIRVRFPKSSEETLKGFIAQVRGVEILPDMAEIIRQRAAYLIKEAKISFSRDKLIGLNLENHREFLAMLSQNKPPEVQAKIDLGYQLLMQDVFKERRGEIVPLEELGQERFRVVIDELFAKSLSAKPDCVYRDRAMSWTGVPLDPPEVQVLALRYGLIDGEPRDYKGIALALGKNTYNMGDKIYSALYEISRVLENKGLVLRRGVPPGQ